MTEKDLIPIRTKAEAIRLGTIGGKRNTEKKRYSNLVTSSHQAKCKNCTAACIFKTTNLKENANHKCQIPETRSYSIWYNQPVMSKEILDKLDTEALFNMLNFLNTKSKKSMNDYKILHDCILNKKKTDYGKETIVSMPIGATQINISIVQPKEKVIDVKKEKTKD